MEDELEFLDNETEEKAASEEAEVVSQEAPSEATEDAQQVASEEAEKPQEEDEKEPVKEAEQPQNGFVPIGAVLDERDKRKSLETKVKELEDQLKSTQKPEEVPDVFEDPQAYANYQQRQTNSAVEQVKLELAEDFARDKYGDELVNEAHQWAAPQLNGPNGEYFRRQIMSQRNPHAYIVQQFQKDQLTSDLSTPQDLEEFKAWRAQKAELMQKPAPQVTPKAPPRSLATATSAGGVQHQTADPGGTFNEIFPE